MMTAAEKIKKMGAAVYVPCLDILMGLKFGDYCYYDYVSNNQPWLEVSDAIYVLEGWEGSEGTKYEISLAKENMLPVFFNMTDLKKFIQKREG
jgi:hypothetical protein